MTPRICHRPAEAREDDARRATGAAFRGAAA